MKDMEETLFETIEYAIYEMERLERNLNIPAKGYVRNCFNTVMRTLREGVKDGERNKMFDELAEKDKEIQQLKRKIMILETDINLSKLEEEDPVRFKMDADGNLTRIEGA